MKKATSFVIGFMIGVVLGIGFYFYKESRAKNGFKNVIYSTVCDTTYYNLPIARDSVVLRYKDKFVPVSKIVTDSIVVRYGDTIPAIIPITQKEYRDSTYEAWVSGYEVNLDSINVFSKTITKTIYTTSAASKNKHWGLGIQAGGGYGLHGFSPYIGIGVQYNFLNW